MGVVDMYIPSKKSFVFYHYSFEFLLSLQKLIKITIYENAKIYQIRLGDEADASR